MDKFLQRNPPWATKAYEVPGANAEKAKQKTQHAGPPQRRPLQEQPDSNVTPKRLSQPHYAADTLRATEKMPEVNASPAKTYQSCPVLQAVPPSIGVTTPTSMQAGHLARLQNDLNSPSATLRVRAMRAIKSPANTAYNVFDVSHTEQNIISADERNPKASPSLPEILSPVVVYVEVRSGNDNRSDGVKTIIAKMGAQVNDRLLRNTTHVVFKDGLLSTYKKATEWKIPVVSILWIEACKVQRRICEPEKFPISNLHKYEYPELYGKITRVRCMQPGSELNKRPPKRPATPTSTTDKGPASDSKRTAFATPTNTAKNDISRFFKALNHNKQLVAEEAAESPATKLLNRISNGNYTPLRLGTPAKPAGSGLQGPDIPQKSVDTSNDKPQAQKSLNFNGAAGTDEPPQPAKPRPRRSTAEPTPVTTPVRTSRRRSSAHVPMTSKADVAQPAAEPEPEPRTTRRRSTAHIAMASNEVATPPREPRPLRRCSSAHIHMASSTDAAAEPEPRMTRRRSSAHSLQTSNADAPPPAEAEPQLKHRRSSMHTAMASNADAAPSPQPDSRVTRRRSSLLPAAKEPQELAPKNVFASIAEELAPIDEPAGDASNFNDPNKTNFVQNSLEISVEMPSQVLHRADKRGTLYTSERMDISKEYQDENVPLNVTARKSLYNSTMQTSGLLDEHSTPPLFSSTRLTSSRSSTNVKRRRTIFNLDMDVINEGIDRLNSSHRLSLVLANQAELGECGKTVVTTEAPRTEEIPPSEPKRRRLFTPNEVVVISPPKSSKKQRLSLSGNNAAKNASAKKNRRRSLAVPVCSSSDFSCLGAHVEHVESTDKFLTPEASVDGFNDVETSSKIQVAEVAKSASSNRRSSVIRTLVHTNMHHGQVQVIQKVGSTVDTPTETQPK